MATSNATKAGTLIFLGAAQYVVLLIVAEILYSGYAPLHFAGSGNESGYAYSVFANTISDLGANCTNSVCTAVPSGLLFGATVSLLGLLVIAGSYYLQKAFHWTPATVLGIIAGIGAVGVGLFPETAGILHHVFTLIVFLGAGLAAIVGARLANKPMFYFSIVLGLMTLVALLLYIDGSYLGLGQGGMERMIAFPALIWALGFGGNLIGREDWS